MSTDVLTDLQPRAEGQALVASGAELVELSERFYRGLFAGAVVFVGLACVAALAMLPFRQSTHAGVPITVIVTALIAALTPVAVWRLQVLYRILRARRGAELTLVAVAAALVAYPLRSELWWPSCALIMLVAILAPLGRTLAYCLLVLVTNLAAHLIAGDLDDTPAVAILGLWVGYPFWAATFSVIGDRFAAHILRLQTRPPPPAPTPRRVSAWVTADRDSDARARRPPPTAPPVTVPDPDGESSVPPSPAPSPRLGALAGLTARQLQVTALLVDGLRYREVAACLAISERQVQRHVTNAIERAGVRNTNELIAVAVAERLAPHRAPAV